MGALVYPRTIISVLLLAILLVFSFTELRVNTWSGLLGFFEWMETTWFGVVGKTWGAAFALVEAFHLVGLALLGGSVLVSDGRLLGLWFNDHPNENFQAQAHRVFVAGLLLLIATGVFMACAVAIKIYYLEVFWYKMLALFTGVLFTYGIKRPVIAAGLDKTDPWFARAVAIASIMIWFTVAATGRWIGFSG